LSDDERELLVKEYGSDRSRMAQSRADDASSDNRKKGFSTWSDSSGKFKVVAKLVEVGDDYVKLEKEDGQQLTVPFARLSSSDLESAKSRAAKQTGSTPGPDSATSSP